MLPLMDEMHTICGPSGHEGGGEGNRNYTDWIWNWGYGGDWGGFLWLFFFCCCCCCLLSVSFYMLYPVLFSFIQPCFFISYCCNLFFFPSCNLVFFFFYCCFRSFIIISHCYILYVVFFHNFSYCFPYLSVHFTPHFCRIEMRNKLREYLAKAIHHHRCKKYIEL